MAEAQLGFGSLDNTALGGMESTHQVESNAIARRSLSIFSRRGTEMPEPTPPFIAQAAIAQQPKLMTEKQKSWIGRRSSVCSSSLKSVGSPRSPKLPRGTILNAVPQNGTIKMTALEEEMATSPNEEIMSAISEHSHSHLTPVEPQPSFWNRSTSSLMYRTKSQKQSDRIGVWADGVVHWDEDSRQERASSDEQIVEEDFGFTPLHPQSTNGLSTNCARPNLEVVIPGKEPLSNKSTLQKTFQLKPQRPMMPIAPAALISPFGVPSPATSVEEDDVSPFESLSTRATPPPELPTSPAQPEVISKDSTGNSRASSSTRSDADHSDDSVESKRSSLTSLDLVDDGTPAKLQRSLAKKDSLKDTLMNASPSNTEQQYDINKPLPPSPIPHPARIAPAPPPSLTSASSVSASAVRKVNSSRSASGAFRVDRLCTAQPLRTSRSLTKLDLFDEQFMRTSPYASGKSEPSSPTLSQAETDLKAHLTTIHENNMAGDDQRSMIAEPSISRAASVRRSSDSVRTVMHPPERAPTIPKRSRRRDWRTKKVHIAQLAVQQPLERRRSESDWHTFPDNDAGNVRHYASGVHRSMSAIQPPMSEHGEVDVQSEEAVDVPELPRRSSRRAGSPPPPPRIVIDDGMIVLSGPVSIRRDDGTTNIAPASAEEVLLNILSFVGSVDDLVRTAVINKGMYRVYKENEMHLLRTVMFNQSPAAWEYMEWSAPTCNEATSSAASSQLEHTPMSYMRCYKRDSAVISALKALIFEHCQTFIRRETALSLASPSHMNVQRVDDAFWRIWTFCKIFGCGKNREEDVTGQLDWLKGGLLANNQNATATVNMNLDFELSSVLLNAPDYFASGNATGLSAHQLYDMIEIWTCLAALLQGYQGRINQARIHGVFDACHDQGSEGDMEEQMLEEWTYHLLTLGPSAILDMAERARDSSSVGFALAKESGWTSWSPPLYNGSRNTFLREPVSRLYEERVATAARKLQHPRELEKKETSRKRVATLAAEIRLARQSSHYKRLPLIDMKAERPMSMHRRDSAISSSRRSSVYSVASRQGTSPVAITPSTSSHSRRASVSHRPTSSGAWSPRKISPIIEDRVYTFNRLSLSNFEGVAEDTSGHAVKKIVDMGFLPAEARAALRMTDMGDGLRVDRAVDLLLRQRS